MINISDAADEDRRIGAQVIEALLGMSCAFSFDHSTVP
jgi:hypothetical protein